MADQDAILIAYVEDEIQKRREQADGKPTASMQLLINDLEALVRTGSENAFATRMIKRAEQNYYDDLLGVPDLPALTLIRDCEKYGLEAIGRNAIRGKYDA
jgi:hypothetical protein